MKQNPLLKTRSWIAAVLVTFAVSAQLACSQHGKTARQDKSGPTTEALATTQPTSRPIDPITAKIRDEGLNHSHVMDTLDYLCNVIGQRLTGSPSCKRANDWTRQTLESWGLQNAHLESWGPFGRGWEVKRFSLQVIEPYAIVLNAYPKAWSPGFEQPFEAPVIVVDATKESELEPFKGKLKGSVVLLGKPRDLQPRFEPLASRMQDSELARLAETRPGTSVLMGQARAETASERRAQFAASGALGERLLNRPAGSTQASTTGPATGPSSRPGRLGGGNRRGFDPFASRALKFVADEGASLVITASTQGDGGTIFVASASVPGDPGPGGAGGPTTSTTTPTTLAASTTSPSTGPTTLAAATTSPTTGPTTRPRVWATDAPAIPAQVTLAVEDYNRLARMSKQGQTLKMAVDFQARFYDNDPMCYNTIAEIPGSDLKDQVVMVGAHMDSWHSGTGATDNGVGAAAAMEAVRIIRTLDLHPRRTIRVALWTGEEQGLFGSEAYVKQHFGYLPERPAATTRPLRTDDPTAPEGGENNPATQPATRPLGRVTKLPDYDNLSVYFNLDNGTGKVRGIYAQGNDAAVPIFRDWLAPFADLGATTITRANTGSTDHVCFDQIGLPGFQFIQDPIEYMSRTHHSNEDVYDRIQADDIKQASTVLASFVWNAAEMDERFPRKP